METKSYIFDNRIRIKLNGEFFSCSTNFSIANLIDYLDFQSEKVILEHNSKLVHSNEFHQSFLKDGDNVEIVTIVGGG
uniref:Thiamine biosynthesis protein n=1 Tax=Porphyridium purpureum TaxID=35688 RepID=W0RYT1_PORPP|nr:thiamine biosynthesis protein [Porphyridium purpureum]ATJ02958.1 thiamine biosynthesis protein [Porphyridium purpureum]BAO23741.1 thiamine biosynthesis protein [Porphyridium purpureum]